MSKTQDWPLVTPAETGGAAGKVRGPVGSWEGPPNLPGAGADFSGLTLSPEMGEGSFKVSQAVGTAHGIAQGQEYQDMSGTRKRMSCQIESGRMEIKDERR